MEYQYEISDIVDPGCFLCETAADEVALRVGIKVGQMAIY